ncbi:MAG: restriction endonuclease subunit S [Abditibacteriota bacterium]|nr:restriction endonuclease subunit S [Abditibacteriota bacterium]
MKIKDIARIVVGKPISRFTEKSGNQVSILQCKDFTDFIDFDNMEKVFINSQERVNFVEKGDILIKTMSPYNICVYDFDDPCVLGSSMFLLKVKEEYKKMYDSFFLGYFISKNLNLNFVSSDGRKAIYKEAFIDLDIPNINYSLQKHIGEAWVKNRSIYRIELDLAKKNYTYNCSLLDEQFEKIRGNK